MSRHAAQSPALAYDYRRAILLVQMIAMGHATIGNLRMLAEEWQVPVYDFDTPDGLMQRLSWHALEYRRVDK